MTLTPSYFAVITAVCGVTAQFIIAYLGRRQIAKQLDLQALVSHRTTATFIADKRQKWIDELRTDMAFHLALSQEIIWKWDAVRMHTSRRVSREATDGAGKVNPTQACDIQWSAADAFSVENGARDRDHQERHIRIMFRLNPKKDLHIKLRRCLYDIRSALSKTQEARTESEAKSVLQETLLLIGEAQEHTQTILKSEWQRVKQEVAYPEVLISRLPKPPVPEPED